ncbi:MAG: mechanosensitive ion channel family protein [Bacillota bacterium]
MFQSFWQNIAGFLPALLAALIVLIVGLLIGSLLGKLVRKIIEMTRIDSLSERIGLRKEVENLGFHLDFAIIIGWMVKWFIYIATLIAVVDILKIPQLTLFLERLVFYLPNVIVAFIIVAVGLMVGKFLQDAVKSSLSKMTMTERASALLAGAAKWAVLVFAGMAALVQLGVAPSLIQILFMGFVLMWSLAGGLAFGLGGKDYASRILESVEKEIGNKRPM